MPFNYSDVTTSVPRVGGHGFTVFRWMGDPIAFAQTLSHQSPQPVSAPVAIQPLDARRPVNIITGAAIGPGTLQLALYELYNERVWDRIMKIVDQKQPNDYNSKEFYNDLSEVFVRLASVSPANGGITCTRIVYPPTMYGQTTRSYGTNYYNCKVTDVRDDETIEIGTMDMAKVLTVQYTHSKPISDSSGSQGLYTSLNQ